MLLVYGIVAAILIGYLMGGRARNYLAQPLRGVLLPALALAIEACFGLLAKRWEPPCGSAGPTCAEYALLAAFVALNFRRRGAKLLALATALNFARHRVQRLFHAGHAHRLRLSRPGQFDRPD